MNAVEKAEPQVDLFSQAVLNFANTGATIIGQEATIDLCNTLSKLMVEKPQLAQKLASPETQKKLSALSDKRKGKSTSFMDLIPLMGDMKDIFDN